MKKLLLISCLLLMGLSVNVNNPEKSSLEVRVKRLEDEVELRRKQIKTKLITADNINMLKNGKITFDRNSTNNDYLSATADTQISVFLTGAESYTFDPASFASPGNGIRNLGSNAANDWDVIYYHTLSQDSGREGKRNINAVSTDTFKADRLPDPQTYERKTNLNITEYGLIADDMPSELIKYDEDNKPMIQTNALIAYLCGILKEQDKRIQKLER